MRTILVLVAALSFVLGACTDKEKERGEKMAKLCPQALKLWRDVTPQKAKLWRKTLGMAINTCSAGCDVKDATSCKNIDDLMRSLCGVTPGPCKKFCKSSKGSLKTHACKYKDTAQARRR